MQEIIENLISSIWKPLLVLCIEIGLVSTILWLVATFIPHNISVIKDLGILSWIVVVVVVRLLLYRSKAVDDAASETEPQRLDAVSEMMLPILERETFDKLTPPEPPVGPRNVRSAIYPASPKITERSDSDGSTRE